MDIHLRVAAAPKNVVSWRGHPALGCGMPGSRLGDAESKLRGLKLQPMEDISLRRGDILVNLDLDLDCLLILDQCPLQAGV